MFNLDFNPYLFLRTPALSYKDYKPEIMAGLLKTQFFQSAIFFASESLYLELERCGFDYYNLDKKVKTSLHKYFNRMCYRPTPFGMFSAFSSTSWNSLNISGKCVLEERGEVYVNPDFQFTADIARRMERTGEFSNVKYYTNDSIYTIQNEKRYLTTSYDINKKKTDFFINSFQTDRLLNKLLNFCNEGKKVSEVVLWLNTFIDETEDVKAYVKDLISEGLLVSELSPNMSGEKYFSRVVAVANARKYNSELAREISMYNGLINKICFKQDMDIKALSENHLYQLSKTKFKSMFYVGYERETKSTIDPKYQVFIKEGLNCLKVITSDATPKALIDFKGKFKARFEDQEVPFLQALDRESGIGYEGLETNLVTSELLDGIQLDLQSNSLNFTWTQIHEFFLSKFLRTKNDEPILITDKELEKLKAPSELKAPPSFSVVFRLFGDKVWIEQAGGCTATALLGRFTLFSEKVLEEVQRIAAVEEKSNDEVIFAEISCFNDEHAANINSNSGIRAFEIPIGVHSTLRRRNIISLSDLTISIVDNNIILRSKKYNKIVIPRLSSAFNYGRSELSIFMFLCDMQYQGLKFNFNFDLRTLLPGLSYYPRVEYKNCILFPATWVLNVEEIAEISDGNGSEDNFFKISEKIRLKRHFALTEGDNQLLFDHSDSGSIELFIKIIKNKPLVVLQEVFLDETTDVCNHDGKPFAGQFITAVFSRDVTYIKSALGRLERKKNKVKRVYLPGDEWVYLKIYCHPATSNNILTKCVRNIIAGLKKQNILKSWYFIRYNDPDNHLRIRIQTNPDDTATVVRYFEKKIRTYVEKGIINNLLLDTYKREIERYGAETIVYAENAFNASSELVSTYLKNISTGAFDFSELHLALLSADALLEIFFPEYSSRIYLLKNIHENMKHEFDDSKQVKMQLDNKYREYSAFINNMKKNQAQIIGIAGKKEYNSYLKSLSLLKTNAQLFFPGKVMKLAADIIHMHLNRLFNEKQRSQEFIIYYLLYKYYLSVKARKDRELLNFAPASKRPAVNQLNETIFK
ncbi:lantibiotic dehydratase [Mucilaginibacter sp.]|uniref:lantibiotic dehydratase n=1 Tax=Mucilaginibacter sp. TaxID=1882438 RepID=UPI00283DC182|nr:lantibiotic dehydratase [Mucilaginibacter sp.]MDR3696108.1 lantibiotic dehydratase [Mucilaginibacter sp.]